MLELVRDGLTRTAVNLDFQRSQKRFRMEVSPPDPGTCETAADTDARFEPLVRTIESEIIPRLMFAHRLVESQPLPAKCLLEKPSQTDVFALTQLLLKQDASQALDFVDALRSKDMLPESLYLDLLAPAARSLGVLWESDVCDFVEVTIALGRLHQVLRVLSPVLGDRNELCPRNRRVLLASVPGEQHSFGLAIVAEFFRLAGWGVWGGQQDEKPDLPAVVRSEWFDAAGFSVGCDCRLDGLARCICSVRSASLNDKIAILVGGPLFIEHPEYTALVGADASTADAKQAVIEAERLVALRC